MLCAEEGKYNVVNFTLAPNSLSSLIKYWMYTTELTLGSIQVLGIERKVSTVIVNGVQHQSFSYKAEHKVNNIINHIK